MYVCKEGLVISPYHHYISGITNESAFLDTSNSLALVVELALLLSIAGDCSHKYTHCKLLYCYLHILYRQANINLTADNSPYNITVLMRFTVAEHYNTTFVFEAASSPVWLTLSSKMKWPVCCFNCCIAL